MAESTAALEDPIRKPALVQGDNDFTSVTDIVCKVAETPKPPKAWYVTFTVALGLAARVLSS